MRSKIVVFIVGCGLVVAAMPAMACSWNTQASSDQQQQQQTAQAQTSSQTSAQ